MGNVAKKHFACCKTVLDAADTAEESNIKRCCKSARHSWLQPIYVLFFVSLDKLS